jgi:hypothetical protein
MESTTFYIIAAIVIIVFVIKGQISEDKKQKIIDEYRNKAKELIPQYDELLKDEYDVRVFIHAMSQMIAHDYVDYGFASKNNIKLLKSIFKKDNYVVEVEIYTNHAGDPPRRYVTIYTKELHNKKQARKEKENAEIKKKYSVSI